MSDPRDFASSERWWIWTDGRIAHMHGYGTENEDGEPIYQPIEVDMEVCTTCDGRGAYVNPNIDRHGLSREDFEEDPDFEDGYRNHAYDVQCDHCQGANVIPVPRNPKEGRMVEECLRDRQESYAEMEAERRMGA
jgi:hypothetical protein